MQLNGQKRPTASTASTILIGIHTQTHTYTHIHILIQTHIQTLLQLHTEGRTHGYSCRA